jgi:sugar lactone lactonase YvrE
MCRLTLCYALLLVSARAPAQNIFTIAGYPRTHRDSVDSKPALNAPLGSVYGLLIDRPTGRLLFNDESLVLRVEPDGSLLTIAGLGNEVVVPQLGGFAAPPVLGPASFLQPAVLRGMAEDSTGALYLADAGAGRIYRVGLDGLVTTFAGGGIAPPGFQSDGGLATAASIGSPRGLVFDSKGNLNFTEVYCNCIRQVTPVGIISTLYTAPASPVKGRLPNIEGLAIDSKDNLYYTEWFGNMVMKVSPGGSATPIAGTGTAGFTGDGGPAIAAELNGPSGITLDGEGNIYIADTMNNRIRKITPDGIINSVAGTTVPGSLACTAQSGSPASTQLCLPAEVMFDPSGDLIISDYGNRLVRALAPAGAISTVAGSGKQDPNFSNLAPSGDGGPEINATFSLLGGAAFDPAGNLYVSDANANTIRKISASGVVSTIAGNGQNGYSGDGQPAIQAEMSRPGPIAVGPDGAVYLITGDSRVRKITPDGIIHLVAGTGVGSGLTRDQGDGGPAMNATLNEPGGVAFDARGNIFIADTSNARVRKIDSNGIITTFGQTGQQGVDYYNAVAVDPQGNVYVAWTHAPPPTVEATVNRINPDGSFTRVGGSGQPCVNGPGQFTDDGAPALQARLCAVTSMTTGPNGLLYLSEGGYSLVLSLPADGTIRRVAGNTAAQFPGDGGPALQASLHGSVGFSPLAVTFDPSGNLYIPDPGYNWIRMVTSTPYAPVLSPAFVGAGGSLSQAVTVSANFAEPFPYSLRVSTNDGGAWLTTNRVTGLTGESFEVNINTRGLGPGFYDGVISVTVYVPVGGGIVEVDLPVTLTI